MWKGVYRNLMSGLLDKRLRNLVSLSTALLMGAAAATSTLAQTCPASVDGNRLDRNTTYPSSHGFNTPVCSPDNLGGEVCRINCDYMFPRNMQTGVVVSHFSVLGVWTTRPNRTESYSSYSCRDISDFPFYVNSSNKVADVLVSNVGSLPVAKALGRQAAQQLVTVLEPHAIQCPNRTRELGQVVGRIVGFSGDVQIIAGGLRAVTAKINYPAVMGDRVKTGPNSRVRIEIADMDDRSPIGPTVVNIGEETEIVITELYAKIAQPRRSYYGLFELVRGYVHYFTKGWGGDSNFSIRSGATVCGIRGTDFVARYDPQTQVADYFLKSGAIELKNNGRVVNLTAGNSVSITRDQFAAVRALDNDVWKSFETATAESSADGGGSKTARREFIPNTFYTLVYNGKPYLTHYEKGTDAGRPIDLFYFWINKPNGGQAEQDGAKLWGRFVRVPSITHPDQSNVVWWIANYKLVGKRWVADDIKGISVEVK